MVKVSSVSVHAISGVGSVPSNSCGKIQSRTVVFGYYGLIKEIVARMKEELGGDALVIATGGFGNTMAQGTDCIDEVDQMLTLEGLRLIFEKNRK